MTLIEPADERWYCLRTGPRQEDLASRNLSRLSGVSTFLPRIRFRRATRRGPVWFTEPLFPRYLFARFDRAKSQRYVLHTHGVTGWVHFGDTPADIPDATLMRLRDELGEKEIKIFDQPLQPGDQATVVAGPMQGIEVVVRHLLPSPERVRVLLEFLGREMEVEMHRDNLALPKQHPLLRTPAGPKRHP
ncbi:MAG: hypothetical protein KBA51_00820 [Kiritimatiellae bacterium]|nr:hypothetical protein [Kiritimatiellia bacterium]